MHKIKTNNVNIYYEITGEDPTLVLLHGWTENHKFWKLYIPDFSKYFKVISIDLRGHGAHAEFKIIEGAGHHTMLEKPDEFRDAVFDFLRKLDTE